MGGAAASRGTNGLAIASFVLALLWLCLVGSVLGIVFGFIALSQIKRRNQSGRGLAIAGIILGILGIVATVVITIVVVNKADELLNDPEEARDVTLESCTVGADGKAEAVLSVHNTSSKTSGYIIRVRFTEDDDALNVGGVDDVPAGETQRFSVDSDQEVSAADLDCAVTLVNRLASGGND